MHLFFFASIQDQSSIDFNKKNNFSNPQRLVLTLKIKKPSNPIAKFFELKKNLIYMTKRKRNEIEKKMIYDVFNSIKTETNKIIK